MVFGGVVIEDDNRDFALFGPAGLAVALFAVLFVLYGLIVSPSPNGWTDMFLPCWLTRSSPWLGISFWRACVYSAGSTRYPPLAVFSDTHDKAQPGSPHHRRDARHRPGGGSDSIVTMVH